MYIYYILCIEIISLIFSNAKQCFTLKNFEYDWSLYMLQAARSEIFKNMLDSDGCKAAPTHTITLPELNHEELDSLLEFLYSGSLPLDKLDKHVYSLSLAADKYEIPFLQKFCEQRMLGSLSSLNALDVLEISDACSSQTVKETAMNYIVKNMEDIVFSTRYESFVLKNPHLCVQITRASFMDAKTRKNGVWGQ